MKKRNFIILGSVGALLAFGWFSSLFVDWPIDFSAAGGDISKASRFSREMESEKLTNMEELLKTDTTFKDGIVVAQMVMQTRAVQFGALVDMSNQVAGNIPAFAEVLKEMNATLEMVNNVANSLLESGNNLEAALSGKECSNLEQTTINASLAYTTLQKQNKLANKFIDTTDKYLKTAKGDDHLKFVRDQWVDYQKMTAALDGDKDAAEAMAKKGNLLSGEKALVAMADFGVANQVAMVNSAYMTKNTGVEGCSLASALSKGTLENVVTIIRSAAEVFSNTQGANATNSQEGAAMFNQRVSEALNNIASANIASKNNAQTLASKNNAQTLASKNNAQTLASKNNAQTLASKNNAQTLASNTGMVNLQSTNMQMMNNNVVTENFQNVLSSRGRPSPYGNTTGAEQLANKTQHTQLGNEASSTFLCNQASEVIRATAAGNMVSNRRKIEQ
jgi:hypothetical protein